MDNEAELEGLNDQTELWKAAEASEEYKKKQRTCHCDVKRERLPWLGCTNAEIQTDMYFSSICAAFARRRYAAPAAAFVLRTIRLRALY